MSAIDESNWGEFAAAVLEAEAEHWEAEYAALANRYGSSGARKAQAAWRLGAEMLKRRTAEYRKVTTEGREGVRVRVTKVEGESK